MKPKNTIFPESESLEDNGELRTTFGGVVAKYKYEDAARWAVSAEGVNFVQAHKTMIFGGAPVDTSKPAGGYLPLAKNVFFQND